MNSNTSKPCPVYRTKFQVKIYPVHYQCCKIQVAQMCYQLLDILMQLHNTRYLHSMSQSKQCRQSPTLQLQIHTQYKVLHQCRHCIHENSHHLGLHAVIIRHLSAAIIIQYLLSSESTSLIVKLLCHLPGTRYGIVT